MALPRATVIAQFLVQDGVGDSPVRLRAAIAVALHRRTALGADAIAEHAESVERYVRDELYRIATEDRRRGADPALTIDESDGEPYVRGLDGRISPFRNDLLRLEPAPFEHLCLDLLRHLGADGEVTGGTGDGGVDFMATGVRFGAPAIAPVTRGLVSVLGQAKRYGLANIVTLNELRQFVGAVSLRVNELRKHDSRFAPLSPIVYAFWTTSDFHGSAVHYAQEMGLWILNGRALAQLICESEFVIRTVQSPPSLDDVRLAAGA